MSGHQDRMSKCHLGSREVAVSWILQDTPPPPTLVRGKSGVYQVTEVCEVFYTCSTWVLGCAPILTEVILGAHLVRWVREDYLSPPESLDSVETIQFRGEEFGLEPDFGDTSAI